MDLHPGEQVVFEGHPSWRALLSFYVGGVAAALAIAVVIALLSSSFSGSWRARCWWAPCSVTGSSSGRPRPTW